MTCCPTCGRQLGVNLWTRQTILLALLGWANEHEGELPSYRDWRHKGRPVSIPNAMTVNRHFGSWTAAIQAALDADPAVFAKRRRYRGKLVAQPASVCVPAEVRYPIPAQAMRDVIARRRTMSIEDLGELSGLNPRQLRRLINSGQESVSLDVADRIVCALGCPEELAIIGRDNGSG